MKKVLGFISVLALVFWSCKDTETPSVPESQEVQKAIYESMREWYFWTQELTTTPDYTKYSTNEDFLNAIIYKPLDRFSYLTTKEAFSNAFVGKNAGHGFGFAFNAEERLFLTYVFDQAPAGKDGWKRGWEIIQINGKPISEYKTSSTTYDFKLGGPEPGITNTFTFRLPDGTTTTRSNTKAEYQSNSVLEQKVFEVNGKKVGYWVYNSFKATEGLTPTRSQEVQNSMEYFQGQGVKEMIIDLRYNGGGSVAVAEQILNYLIQGANSNKVMYSYKHNVFKTNYNTSRSFAKAGTLALDRIIFITSRGTASASELVINSLTPYMDIVLVGDNTYGKPVGSFPLSSYNRVLQEKDVELVPITFATANSQGKAEYFDGFPANFSVGDSPEIPWGDTRDARLNAALQYIQTGNVSGRILNSYFKPKWEMIDAFEGLQKEFPAY